MRLKRNGPPPGFPIVEGDYSLSATWSIYLPEQFARRVEEGQLVLWRPGFTVWFTAWNNDHKDSKAKRLAKIKESAAPERFAVLERETGALVRFSYRLRDENEDGPVQSLYGFVLNDEGHLEIGIYFDHPADEAKALQLIESVAERRRTDPAQ